MKVRIALTVDIDPEMWTLNYGVESAEAIRSDVKAYCEDTIVSGLHGLRLWNGDKREI